MGGVRVALARACRGGFVDGEHHFHYFSELSDPVDFVGSFARPDGNVTGFVVTGPTMAGKWVELLKEIAPQVVRSPSCSTRDGAQCQILLCRNAGRPKRSAISGLARNIGFYVLNLVPDPQLAEGNRRASGARVLMILRRGATLIRAAGDDRTEMLRSTVS